MLAVTIINGGLFCENEIRKAKQLKADIQKKWDAVSEVWLALLNLRHQIPKISMRIERWVAPYVDMIVFSMAQGAPHDQTCKEHAALIQ
jgi:hypothetical protein